MRQRHYDPPIPLDFRIKELRAIQLIYLLMVKLRRMHLWSIYFRLWAGLKTTHSLVQNELGLAPT